MKKAILSFAGIILLSAILVSCGSKGPRVADPPPPPKVDPQKAFETQKGLAVASLRRGNFPQALKEIDEAIVMDGDDPEVYLIKGAIYFGLKDYSRAEALYMTSLEKDPAYAMARFNLCGLYLKQGKYDSAIAECSRLTDDALFNARENAYTNIGIAYFNKGDIERAKQNYELALQINPAFVYAHNELGKLYMSAGRYGEAIEEFKQAITGLPTYEEAYYNLALAYIKVGQNLQACESFARVVDLAPGTEYGVNSNKYLSSLCQP